MAIVGLAPQAAEAQGLLALIRFSRSSSRAKRVARERRRRLAGNGPRAVLKIIAYSG